MSLPQLYVVTCGGTHAGADAVGQRPLPSRSIMRDVLPLVEKANSRNTVAIDLTTHVIGDAGAVALFDTLMHFEPDKPRIHAVVCPQNDLRLAGVESLCRFLRSPNGRLVQELNLQWNEFVAFRAAGLLLSAIRERSESGAQFTSLLLEGTNIPPHLLRKLRSHALEVVDATAGA